MSVSNVTEAVEDEQDNIPHIEPESLEHASPALEREFDYDSDTVPTLEEWKTMKGYGSFITHDDADAEHVFHINDIIYVLPTGQDPDEEIDRTELWLAQIRSIRAHDSQSVWIRAKWFYHPKELPKNTKGAKGKSNQFGEFERISSNQADFIPTSTCCGVAKITEFDEQSLEQEEIEPDSFYYRCDYDWQKQVLRRPTPPCSICKKPYNPDTDVMHFCPRQGCCRSWHAPCLAKANWLIMSSDDFSQRMESLDGKYVSRDAPKASPKKKKSGSATASVPNPSYARIPKELLAIARQPIVRGGMLGVVGNVRSVVRARTMVQNALKGIEDIPENWEEKLGRVYDVSGTGPITETRRKQPALAYQCPQCGEPI